jgi:hypothetical protein
MPAKLRLPKNRRPVFGAEVLRLFAELEHGTRRGTGFKKGERRLMSVLGLNDEWWRGSSVFDRAHAPYYPSHTCAYADFFRVRAVRRQLLAAIGPTV